MATATSMEPYPKYVEELYNWALAWQGKGDFDAAIQDYSNALEIAPKFVDAYVNRGQARQSRHDFDGAISDILRGCD